MDARVWQSESVAATYIADVRRAVPLTDVQIDVMLRLIAGCGRPVRRFLDLGCGDGILGRAILTRFPEAEGVFLDFSETMLDAARTQLADGGGSHRFIAADFGKPDWVDGIEPFAPFDAIVSGFAIHHQPDARKRGLYAEIFDLLASGGIFVHVEHVSSPTEWVRERFDECAIDALYAAHVAQGTTKTRDEIAREFFYRPDKAANILAPVEAQCAWLREIGFVDVDCYFKLFELAVFGGRRPGEDG